MTDLNRTAIGAVAVLVALVVAFASMVGGERSGPIHSVRVDATPTVALPGLPPPEVPAAAAERADADRLASVTMLLVLLAAGTAGITLAGIVGSETLARTGTRAVEVMLGAPPRRLVGRVAGLWSRRIVRGMLAGSVIAVSGIGYIVVSAPPGVHFAGPGPWVPVLAAAGVAMLALLSATVPVWRLYSGGRPLLRESEGHQLTDPRPRQFGRVLLIVFQLVIAVALLTASALLRVSGDEPATAMPGPGVLARLTASGDSAVNPTRRAEVLESALAALTDVPGFAAETLATPGAWIGRGPETVALNECGRCSTGGLPHPIHAVQVKHHAVMPGFFERRGLSFLAGRGFGERGGEAAEVVISQAYAEAHFQDPPVLGRKVALGVQADTWHVVVGVVSDIGGGGLGASGSPYAAYYSALEHPPTEVELFAALSEGVDPSPPIADVIETSLSMASGGDLVLSALRPAEDEVARIFGLTDWLGAGSRLAGILATLVALAGMVGALRAHVRSRRREMGIRAALGAEPTALKRLVVGEAVRIGAVGVVLGIWSATAVVGVLGPEGGRLVDPVAFLAIASLFLAGAFLAAVPGATLAATASPREAMTDSPTR